MIFVAAALAFLLWLACAVAAVSFCLFIRSVDFLVVDLREHDPEHPEDWYVH